MRRWLVLPPSMSGQFGGQLGLLLVEPVRVTVAGGETLDALGQLLQLPTRCQGKARQARQGV